MVRVWNRATADRRRADGDGTSRTAVGLAGRRQRHTATRRRGDASCHVVPRSAHGHAGRTVLHSNQQPPGTGTTAPIRAPLIPSLICAFSAPEPPRVRTSTSMGHAGRAGRDGDALTTRCTQLPRTTRENSLTSLVELAANFSRPPLHASTHPIANPGKARSKKRVAQLLPLHLCDAPRLLESHASRALRPTARAADLGLCLEQRFDPHRP